MRKRSQIVGLVLFKPVALHPITTATTQHLWAWVFSRALHTDIKTIQFPLLEMVVDATSF